MAPFSSSNRFSALPTGFPTGLRLLHDPALNKGTAFSYEERVALGLRGLVPPGINTMEEQVTRVIGNYHRKENDLERYIFLVALQDRNQTLFYRVLSEHLEEMLPIIYTPTVGRACQEFVHIFRRPKGVFVSTRDKGHFSEILRNWPNRDVRIIVMTDGGSTIIAMAVAEAVYEKKLAAASKPIDMKAFIQSHMWEPAYVDYV